MNGILSRPPGGRIVVPCISGWTAEHRASRPFSIDDAGAPAASATRAYRPIVRGRAGRSRIRTSGARRWPARSPTSALRAEGARRGEGGRVFRPDAWRGRPRPIGQAGPPGDPAQRRSGAAEAAASLARTIPHLAGVVGVKPMPGFTGPKLLWLARHEPEHRRRNRLRARAEGLSASRPLRRARDRHERRRRKLDAGRGGAGLVGRGDRRLRSGSGLGAAARRGLGRGRRDPSQRRREFGLPHGRVVAAGGGDAAVGAVGLGAIAPGEAFISLGTASQLIVATDRYLSAPEKLVHSFAHALPGRWYAMAAMLNGAGALAFAAGCSARRPTRSNVRRPRAIRGPARSCSCPISPASGRRSTILTRAAFSSA